MPDMTPPEPAHPEADALRTRWRDIMRQIDEDYISRDGAIDLVYIAIELGKLGYTLTPDQTDWIRTKGTDDADAT